MVAILALYSIVVVVSIVILLCASIFIEPLAWYWIISPIWITWGITLLAFLICAPIAVYLTKDVKPRGRG